MRTEEDQGIPARWLMVPAGVEIDLGPPCAALCRHCGARPDNPAQRPPGPAPSAAHSADAGSHAGEREGTHPA